ncbi:MAG: ABC transporter permease [Anaerolineae bacterium]|nr:MAG: ABC transporter permease [Anaerolineae bacterium]
MRAIDLAAKDLLQIFRDWRAALFLIIMPIAFTLLFGFAFGGFGGPNQGDLRLPVTIINHDLEDLSLILVDMLEDSSVIRVESSDEDDLGKVKDGVKDGEVAAAVVIPAGFSEGMKSGPVAALTIISNPVDNAGRTAQGEIEAGIMRLNNSVETARLGDVQLHNRLGFTSDEERQDFYDQTLNKALESWQSPPVVVRTTSTGENIEASDEGENAFAQTSSGMMAQFAIAGLMGAASILVLERKNRVLKRLLTTPMTRAEILLGHYFAMVIMVIVQLIILILFGQLLLDLNYLGSPLATIMLVVTTALFTAGLGLLIGALAKTEEQVIVFALIPMFVLAPLGGAWVPLEITPETFQKIAYFTPLAWVVEGFKDITVRGQGIQAIIPAALVLSAYTAVLFALAAWRFRFE